MTRSDDAVELGVNMCDNGVSSGPTVRDAVTLVELRNDADEFDVNMCDGHGVSVSSEPTVRDVLALAELPTLDADPPSSSESSIFICGLPPIYNYF